MSAQRPPGVARLQPVCEASNRGDGEYWSRTKVRTKDAENRTDCPVCGKRVKLRKAVHERFANTIPYHHVPESFTKEQS